MFVVTGSPVQAVVDAVKARCESDTVLMTMISGVYGHLDDTARTPYPYLTFGTETVNGDDPHAGAMGLSGARVEIQIDGWSAHQGKKEMRAILSRLRVVLERTPLVVRGYALVAGSVTCVLELVDVEPDADMPERRLYHGVQRWVCLVDEATA